MIISLINLSLSISGSKKSLNSLVWLINFRIIYKFGTKLNFSRGEISVKNYHIGAIVWNGANRDMVQFQSGAVFSSHFDGMWLFFLG